MKSFFRKNGALIVVSVFIAIIIKLYFEMRVFFVTGIAVGLLGNEFELKTIGKLLLLFLIIFVILLLLDRYKKLFIYVDKYRYIIGAAIIILCTIFELSGSSIGIIYTYLGNEYTSTDVLLEQGTLIGVPRAIRSDEWSLFTQFNLSQYYNDYNSVSDIIRGTDTDVTTFYASPCFAVATLFRPFLWGYIALGGAKGLAFYWSARLVVLFLVSYEMGKLLTKNRKVLSAAYAVLITFSPTILWWFSTNGLVEMFIFGQLAVVLLYYLVHTDKMWVKVIICLGIIECAGGYLLAYYPAQQIPLAYVFGALALFIIIDNRKMFKGRDILLIVAAVIVFAGLAGLTVYNSLDTIEATMNTVYPGKRVNTGFGTSVVQLFSYITFIFAPFDEANLILRDNVCEMSVFYSLFPVGIIGAVYSMIKRRKADFLYIILILIEVLFLIYCIFGLPVFASKITLLNYSFCNRIMSIVGFIDIILLFRFLSGKCADKTPNEKKPKILKIVLYIAFIPIIVLVMVWLYTAGLRPSYIIWIMAGALIMWLVYLILRNTAEHKERFAITIICVMSLLGLCINPVQHGTKVIYENETVKEISSIREEDPEALWIFVSKDSHVNNIPVAVGARTINSTNTYPTLERWHKIDKTGQYEDVYNRYAFIKTDITDGDTKFTLNNPDDITVELNQNDLDTLGISYILSYKLINAEGYNKIYNDSNYYIYKKGSV